MLVIFAIGSAKEAAKKEMKNLLPLLSEMTIALATGDDLKPRRRAMAIRYLTEATEQKDYALLNLSSKDYYEFVWSVKRSLQALRNLKDCFEESDSLGKHRHWFMDPKNLEILDPDGSCCID
ncbi:MAG: hypothetical protein GC193_05310 [Cryomorphaceae bacterium]|nr:hypothetical protein [Cryomorphaceae bacterium]